MRGVAWGAWLALVGVACGGIAIIDPDDGAGGSSTTTTTGGGADPLCVDACNAQAPCGIDIPECVARCNQVTPGCEAVREPFLTCIAETTTGVCSIGLCGEEAESYLTCLDIVAAGGSCGSASNSCACLHEDGYGNVYDFQCFGTNDFNCTCSLNGAELGQCTDNGPTPCDLDQSCCAAVVFVRGFP